MMISINTRHCSFTGLLLFFLFLTTALPAQDLLFLSGMPKPEEVLDKIKGRNPADTYTKQAGAFMQLRDMVSLMIDDNQKKYPAASDLMIRYIQQLDPLKIKYDGIKEKGGSRWSQDSHKYHTSATLQAELLDHLMTAEVREMVRNKIKGQKSAKQWIGKTRSIFYKVFGIILLASSVLLFLFSARIAHAIARARFIRTNPSGVEEYPDYDTYKSTRRKEGWKGQGAGWLLLISIIMLFVGLACLIM